MSHLRLALALSAVLACSGSKAAEPPAEVPGGDPPAAEPAEPSAEPPPAPDPAPSTTGAAQAVTKTLFVAPELADCQGEAPQKCLQVRESPGEPYRNLYSGIAGFEHEPSYEYELKVEVSPVPNAPADGSSLRYRLIEIVAKRKAPASKSD